MNSLDKSVRLKASLLVYFQIYQRIRTRDHLKIKLSQNNIKLKLYAQCLMNEFNPLIQIRIDEYGMICFNLIRIRNLISFQLILENDTTDSNYTRPLCFTSSKQYSIVRAKRCLIFVFCISSARLSLCLSRDYDRTTWTN